MRIKHFFVAVLFLIMGSTSSYAQFLKFDDVKALLDLASDQEEAEQFLQDKGYELNDSEDESDDKYKIEYRKTVGDDEYIIYLTGNTDLDVYTAAVFSWSPAVWDYYEHYVHANDFELVDTKKKKGGIFIYDFEGDDYNVSMGSYPEEDGTTLYKVIIQLN